MARFTFAMTAAGTWRVTRAEYLPTVVSRSRPYRLVDLTRALAGDRLPDNRWQADRRAYRHVTAAVNSLGARRDGLLPSDLS